MIFSSLVDYIVGLVIDKYRETKKAKIALLCSILINLSLLMFFKYADFIIENINLLFQINIPLLMIPLPLGISFYTFQTMSYSIDIYRGDAKIQKNPFNFATYVTLFPQLVAGPIVRYQTVANEMTDRKHSLKDVSEGLCRFVIGLGKKVLIANVLGELNKASVESSNQSILFYWMGILSFMLQIYFDFSGYSDMAIGLGRIFGFHFLENFNYPFISKSISEFWQRWHISMGTWFKEYVYIPLGGNRVSKIKWIRNIAIVWFCTGLWHGAAWNFILWGLYFGVMLTFEKMFILKLLKKIPQIFQHLYVFIFITLSFVIFYSETLQDIAVYFKGMFAVLEIPVINYESIYYLKSYAVVIILAVVGSTPLFKILLKKLQSKEKMKAFVDMLTPVFAVLLLIITTAYLVDSSFNPFLYFRF